jgi:integrase
MEHVQRRDGRYYWRARVPLDLIGPVGRREVTRSLDTACPRVARERAAQAHAAVMAAWTEARAATMTGAADRVRGLVEDLLSELEQVTQGRLRSLGPRPSTLATVPLHATLDAARDARAALPGLVAAVAGAEADAGQTARTEAAARALDLDALATVVRGLGGRLATQPTPTCLAYLDEHYTAERQLREDAHRHVDAYIRLWARVLGDRPLAEYGRADVVRWVGVLGRLKRTIGKSSKDKHKSIAQLLEESRGKPTLNTTTIEKHITHLKAFFLSAQRHYRWCTSDDVEDLFRDVALASHVPGVRRRRTWTPPLMTALLASPCWSGTRSMAEDRTHRHEPGPQVHRDAYWWLPIMALWTGARLEELAQLQHGDLCKDREGIYYLAIHSEGDRRTKNNHSIRNVPVHTFLNELGFIGLFDAKKNGRIFPELKKHGRPPSWGALYSSHFTDYRRACGLYQEMLDFHSLRRTFISTLRDRYKVDALTVAALAGHDDSDAELRRVRQTDDYTDYSVRGLAEAVERLDYEAIGVDVGPLRRAAAACGSRGSYRTDR